MNDLDKIVSPHGHFILEVRRSGIVVPELCVDEPNLIVNVSKAVMAALLGGSVSGKSITQISYGTNLTAPAVTDTAITSPFTKNVDSVTYPATGQVQFNFSLLSTEDNGANIGEFGLMTADGELFARKTRSAALAKASDISFSGSWTITF